MESKAQKYLFMDGLNYADYFFERNGSFWSIEKARNLVQEFIQACQNSGWQLWVFLDYGQSTEEASTKWKTRREDDVRLGRLGMLPGINFVLGTLFQEQGIRVFYSEIDNDDTLAAYAQHYGAAVLSEDKDFYRYKDHKYIVYYDFSINQDRINLKKK